MVEELKLAIKIDDASIEQSLLKQFANAQKMADKVVLDFKNVNFDDKQIEAKFKEMQKKAGQNPIDLTIGGNTLDMLGQIDKRLTEIFSIGKGKSFIDSSATVSEINKITQATKELNKAQTGSENIQSKSFTTKNKTEAYNQLKQVADVFKQFYGNEEAMHTKAGTEAAYAYYKAYEEALRKGVAESKLQKVTVDVDKDGFFNAERISSTRIKEFANFEKYGGEVTALSEEISYFEKRLLKFSEAYSQIQSKLGKAPITPEIIQNIEEYVRNLEIAEARTKDADLMGFTKEDIDLYKDSANMYLGFATEDAIRENEKYISSLKEVKKEKENVDASLSKSQISDMDSSLVDQQNKIQEELKETQKQAEQTSESLSKIGDGQKTNISLTSDSTVEQQIKSESELNAEIEKRENIIRELQQLQEKLTVHEDFHGNDRYFADQLPTEEEIREADKRIKQLTGTNNIFNVDKLIQDRNEWLSEVKYSLEEYDDLIKANDQKALDEYTTRGLSRIGGAESFFGYEDNNFSIASKFVEEKEKIQNEINDLYTDLDKLDEKMNLDSNNSSVDNTVQSQEKLQSELKETQKQAEKTAQAVKESTTTASTEQKKDAFPDKDVSTSVESATNSIKEENNVLEQNTQKVKENTQAKKQNVNANLNKYDKRLDSYNGKIDKYQATIDRLKDGGWTSSTYLENVQAVRDAVKQYETLLNELKGKDASLVTSDDISKLDNYEKKIKDTIATVTNMSAAEKGYSQLAGQKEIDKINKILRENSAMSSEAKAKIKAYKQELISGNPSVSLEKIHGEIMKIVNAEELAGRAGKSMFDVIKEKAFYGFAAQIGMYFGFNDIVNGFKQVASTVRELDTAYTEMRKVSDESAQSLKNFQKESFSTADSVGTTALAMQDATATWMRLGESLDDAKESAKDATVLLNVSEFDNIDEATDSLVAMSQAYKDLDKMEIIDVLDKIGNEYSISTDQLSTALKDSAAVLKTQGNDLAESVALITAGKVITCIYRNIYNRMNLIAGNA